MRRATLEQRSLVTSARALGDGKAVYLPEDELSAVISVILSDLDHSGLAQKLGNPVSDERHYFERPLSYFDASPFTETFWNVFLECSAAVEDFATYFRCVCEIHKRRRKYDRILSHQPFPTSDQIAPRALLEFGFYEHNALATWLTWRKWLFDLDNRAGQETGYLFEPILAAALGGVPFPAPKSPVRRANDSSKARQVDCIVDEDAYEFKIRVTIAASGQGRWGEELAFPLDCAASGFRPILVVLDPTPNHRLTDLSAAFRASGGLVYVGDAAWELLEERAGATMAVFLENYVKKPIAEIGGRIQRPGDMKLSALADGNVSVSFDLEQGPYARVIQRAVVAPDDIKPEDE